MEGFTIIIAVLIGTILGNVIYDFFLKR